ncbi:type II toxin-antitoxin system Phd/YefM family antitoxin [Tepidibacillus sp. LV47]|uniref:type II toxin-antitoxin system Phd/YefM family antitoxin n=1 Tax=Tepidibacillus sp. LV47 TaxID=3398228 RepID=UPI003AADD299
MLQITSTEFKKNLGKYLALVNKEDIIITRNGIPIAQLSPPKSEKVSLVNQLMGVIPDDGYTVEDARKERLMKNEDNH